MNENIFTGLANIYEKYRPMYPISLFSYLQKNAGINLSSVIADIGSGTGILTQELLKICGHVYAIEPNTDMRNIAESKLSLNSNFTSISAVAENTTLQEESVDFITVAQAFHWFDKIAFKKESKRILKKQGIVILIWNRRKESDLLIQEIDSISQEFCPTFSGSSKGMRGATQNDSFDSFFEEKIDTVYFENSMVLNKDSFLGLHKSASYCPPTTDPDYRNYMNALAHYFDTKKKNNTLSLPNETVCYVGKV